MAKPVAVYTTDNCHFAGLLQWSLALYWKEPQHSDDWLPRLADACEPDGIRIQSHRFRTPTISLFHVGTLGNVSPKTMLQRIKGRLQAFCESPQPLRTKYSIRSIGNVSRDVVQAYVAEQLGHHKMADPEVQSRMNRYQIHQAHVDLAKPSRTARGQYWFNLHVVLVHRERWASVSDEKLTRTKAMILAVARKYELSLSRAAVLTDHVHLSLGCKIEHVPYDIAIRFLNNLAFVYDMAPLYQFGGYVGTFGEYTTNAIRTDS